ncbi:unnamed protein product [Brachionus calyciflorus]|uniref:Uncharacterized protein n=1 Tax=Brachionus calyciflorus TaxID=104777 RepID=A0A814BZU2_9BILA|nr:unnamed protein product [Brachionus calyciflorus]
MASYDHHNMAPANSHMHPHRYGMHGYGQSFDHYNMAPANSHMHPRRYGLHDYAQRNDYYNGHRFKKINNNFNLFNHLKFSMV